MEVGAEPLVDCRTGDLVDASEAEIPGLDLFGADTFCTEDGLGARRSPNRCSGDGPARLWDGGCCFRNETSIMSGPIHSIG